MHTVVNYLTRYMSGVPVPRHLKYLIWVIQDVLNLSPIRKKKQT